ncbi:unnamed protein product [Sordaria macrospora k-hell]|uniref:WGS project CABT00000000 data, contig 2.59 n=1 Tax=Sordaria macrospora (strain ATCC MYA-333 / DSM 997 / K(L3346) / K-hell) TaxID=771870 RepID=F7WA95_SORMK|nr:uncharacterized protein SMAC_08541 [Sordaria macrospora k-hell]CCC05289.1 unnamed protein product [Sordaria macrospora k-hell]
MAQPLDEMSDARQPSDIASFNTSPVSHPNMADDGNNLEYSSPNHAHASQNLDVASGVAVPLDPMLFQQYGNRIEDGDHSNQAILTSYNQYSGLMEPAWANMSQCMPRLGQHQILTPPVVANTGPQEQQGQTDNSGVNRWTPKMDKRLLLLKNDGKPHKFIAKTLATEFPSAKGLNDNMVAKRLRSLRENAANATKVDKCVNRCLPKMLPVLADAVAQVAQEHGYEHVENEKEDIELELRAELKKIIQKRMLDRQRPRATGPATAASQTQNRVTKPTGRRTRAHHVNSGNLNSQSGNASGSTDPSAPKDFGPVANRD